MLIKKIISLILSIMILSTGRAYSFSVNRIEKLRLPLQASSVNINRIKKAVEVIEKGRGDSIQTVFTEQQKQEIVKEIRKYCRDSTKQAEEILEYMEQLRAIVSQNPEDIVFILKEIPKYAERNTRTAYNSFIVLLESKLFAETNQPEILRNFLDVIKEVSQYTDIYANNAYNKLAILLEAGFITLVNEKEVFGILKGIPKYAEIYTNNAYNSLTFLFTSKLITETNQEALLALLKEIPKYAKIDTHNAYDGIETLLVFLKENNLSLDRNSSKHILYVIKTGNMDEGVRVSIDSIREYVSINIKKTVPGTTRKLSDSLNALLSPVHAQQRILSAHNSNKAVFTKIQKQEIIKEIKRYCSNDTKQAMESLENLEKSEVLTNQNMEDIFIIVKRIPECAAGGANRAYDNLKALLESNSIVQNNQNMVIDVLKEATTHTENKAMGDTFSSLKDLLESNLVTEFNQEEVFAVLKEIFMYTGKTALIVCYALTDFLGSDAVTESNQKEIFAILKEIPRRLRDNTNVVYNRFKIFLESNLINQANHEPVFVILKKMPKCAKARTSLGYDSLASILIILKLKTQIDQEVIFNILKEIPEYAGIYTGSAYDALLVLLKSKLITEFNCEKVLKDFSDILKEIRRRAKTYTADAYNRLADLFASDVITELNQESVFTVLKEISRHARSKIPYACDRLKALLRSGLITQVNQEAVFVLLKEIPEHAAFDTCNSYDSLEELLILLKENSLVLDLESASYILYAIKNGRANKGVKNTLDSIKDYIAANIKKSVFETLQTPHAGNLNALFNPIATGRFFLPVRCGL